MSDMATRRVIVDEALLRGLMKRDLRPLLGRTRTIPISFNDARHPIHRTMKPVLWRAQSGRIPDPQFFERFVGEFAEHVLKDVVHIESREDGDVSSFPDNLFRRYSYFIMRPGFGRMLKARSSSYWSFDADMGVHDTDLFEIALHAIERFYQRTRLPVAEHSLPIIGRDLVRRFGLLLFFMESELEFMRSFAMPYGDGMFLGIRGDDLIEGFIKAYSVKRGTSISFNTAQDQGLPLPRILTFIGPGEMTPRQADFISSLRHFERIHGEDLGNFSLFYSSHGELLSNDKFVDAVFESPDTQTHNYESALNNFLELSLDQESLKATGNWDVARTVDALGKSLFGLE